MGGGKDVSSEPLRFSFRVLLSLFSSSVLFCCVQCHISPFFLVLTVFIADMLSDL